MFNLINVNLNPQFHLKLNSLSMQNHLPERQGKHFARRSIFLTILVGLLAFGTALAQTTISGRILSGEDNSPMPGVNIVVKGTTNGTCYRMAASS